LGLDCLDYRHSDRTRLVLRAIDPATLVISRFFSPDFPGFSTYRATGLNRVEVLRETSTDTIPHKRLSLSSHLFVSVR
jgi:hypothetical protein